MKVRMIMQMSGPRHDGSDWPPHGGEFDVPDWEAPELIAGGLAVPVAEERKVESASMVPDPKVEVRAPDPQPPHAEPPAAPPADDDSALPMEMRKRGPGRPPGSPNRPK